MRPPNPSAPATNLVLPRDVKAKLIREAKKRGVPMAAVVAEALAAWWAAPGGGEERAA